VSQVFYFFFKPSTVYGFIEPITGGIAAGAFVIEYLQINWLFYLMIVLKNLN